MLEVTSNTDSDDIVLNPADEAALLVMELFEADLLTKEDERSSTPGLDSMAGCHTLNEGVTSQGRGARVPDNALTASQDEISGHCVGGTVSEAPPAVGVAVEGKDGTISHGVKSRGGVVRASGPSSIAPIGAGRGAGEACGPDQQDPRRSNNGGQNECKDSSPWKLKPQSICGESACFSHFDYYSATVRADWQALVQYLQDDCLALSLNDRGKFGYSRAYDGMTHDGHEFTLWCDGNMGADPSVHGRGKHSPGIASMLRSLPYSHTVSRVDSAIEFEGEGTWDALYSCLLAFAEEHHIKRSSFNDLEEGAPHGRTLYIGSRKSPAFLRCYEKGKQLGNPKSTWVRVELVIRPQKNQRVEASRATPDNIWGYCRWASLLAPLLVEGFAPQLIRADTKKSKDELDVRLVKAFQRHRNLFTNGICKYGEEDFCEMMFTALGRRSTVTASDWG